MILFSKLKLFLAAGLLVASANAMAQVKTEKVELDVAERKLEKKEKEKISQTRITRNEAFLIATETRLKGEIIKAIKFLSRTFRQLPKKSPARLQMQEKLMNLRLELAVYEANDEMRAYDKSWEAWDRGGRRGREPKLNSNKSRQQWNLLASEARQILQDYPRSKNADVTMFNIALSQNFLGREKDSARTFSQLIAKYPNSQKSGDAYFALGDFYFDRNDFRNAMNNYKNALRFRKARTYAYSLFKLGWCNYNLGKYQTALAFWKKTVSESEKGGKRTLALKEEALRDLVFVFAELKQVEPAIAYYRRHGGEKYIGKFLILLSQTFVDQGRYGEAIKVLKRFQQVAPTAEEAPDTQKEIVNLYYELGRFKNVWSELAAFPRLFGPSSRWASANQSRNRKRYLEVQQMIKDQILYYAKVTHKKAQADDNKRGYAEAMKGYSLFLKSYPKSKEVAEIKYNMADIEYFSKRFAQAGKLYYEICLMGKQKAVIYDAKTGKPSNIHKQSAEYMLDAYSQLFEPEYKVLIKRKVDYAKSRPPKPLSTNAKLFIKACANYTKFYPADKKLGKKCDVFITKIFYHSGNKEQAKKYLWNLAKKYPGTEEGNNAVETLVPLYKGDDKALLAVTNQLLKIPAYQKGKIGKNLKQLQKDISRKELQNMKDRSKRAVAYEKEYRKNPRDAEADKLIYNAALDYLATGGIPKAIAAYTIVITKHPKSDGAKDALIQLAKLHEQRVDLAQAANYFKKYAATYPKDKIAVAAMAKSCELEAAIEKSSAISSCLDFAKVDEQGAKFAFNRMIRSAFTAKQSSRLSGLVKTYLQRFRVSPGEKIEALSYLYDVSNGQGGAAASAANQILSTFRSGGKNVEGEPLATVGKIVFKKVNGEMGRYLKYQLKGGSVEVLAKSIEQKTAALQRVTAAYQEVLATADPYWGVAALYQTGYAFEQFYNDLADPPSIKGAKIEDVRKELSGQANEALQGARNYYGKARELISKAFVYNEWAANVISGINRLSGSDVLYDDLVVTPDFVGAEVPSTVANSVKGGN